MTKQDLLDDLVSKGFALVNNPEKVETKPNGDIRYVINIRGVNGKVVQYKNIEFYVIDEGGEAEAAYYKDSEPEMGA